MARIFEQLTVLGGQRIAAGDLAGIDVQGLSLHSSGVEQVEPAEAFSGAGEARDFLAEAVKRHPNRFARSAPLPTAAPGEAAGEPDRQLSFS